MHWHFRVVWAVWPWPLTCNQSHIRRYVNVIMCMKVGDPIDPIQWCWFIVRRAPKDIVTVRTLRHSFIVTHTVLQTDARCRCSTVDSVHGRVYEGRDRTQLGAFWHSKGGTFSATGLPAVHFSTERQTSQTPRENSGCSSKCSCPLRNINRNFSVNSCPLTQAAWFYG